MTWPTVALTGHRDLGDARPWVGDTLVNTVVPRLVGEHGMETGCCGMALGADTVWGCVVHFSRVRLWAHIPYPQQADRWPQVDRSRWEWLRSVADQETVYGGTDDEGPGFDVRWLHARNAGMIRVSQAVVAVWDGREDGGTYGAVRLARSARRPIVLVDPGRRLVEWPETPETLF